MSPGQRITRAACVAASLFTVLPFSLADEQLAERRYRAARDLERAGQSEQAREIYRQIADDDAGSARADDALLALARLAWPTSDPDLLADPAHDPAAVLAARSSLAMLRERHPTGDAAAEGSWRLALTHLVPRAGLFNADEASALLTTLPVLYPDAPEVPGALALAAALHEQAGRREQATGLAFRLLTEHPESPVAARAWLVLGRLDAEAGRSSDAMRCFGRAAIDGAQRDRATSESARDLATVLDRVTFGPLRQGPAWSLIPGGVPADLRVADLAVSSDGSFFVVSSRDQLMLVTDSSGAVRERRAVPALTAVALDAHSRSWLATETTILPPGAAPVSLGERREIRSIAPAGPGRLWVVDDREKGVFLFSVDSDIVIRATLPGRMVPLRVASAARGGAWVLTERPAALVRLGADGKPRASVDLEALAREPIDLDVDGLGNVYVLDARAPAVLVLNRGGAVVSRIALPEGDQGVEKPSAIAVDRSGGIAIADARTKRIAWFR